MVCRVHIAPAFKTLAADLWKHLSEQPAFSGDPLLAPIVFVPTYTCVEDIRREWACAHDIAMNIDFLFFGDGLRKILRRDTDWDFVKPELLHHQILCCLLGSLKENCTEAGIYAPAMTQTSPVTDELRLHEFAGILAEHFDNYDLHRAASAEFQAKLRADKMQSALYAAVEEKIHAHNRAVRANHAGKERFFLREICSPKHPEWQLDEQKKKSIAAYGLHLFALTDIPPLHHRVLRRLCAEAGGDLHLWHLTPLALAAGEYTDDANVEPADAALPPVYMDPGKENDALPFASGEIPAEHRQIAQKWTRASRSFLRTAATAAREHSKITLTASGDAPSLLPPSFRIVGAPSILRELEFVYNSILWHLTRVTHDAALTTDDFAVLMPDPESNRAHIEMVFSGREQVIPYSIMGKRGAKESRWAEALTAILDLASDMTDGFSRAAIARVLDNDCILAACGAKRADLNGYLRWMDALGIFGGEVISSQPVPPAHSWARALARLRLGRIMRLPEGKAWEGIFPWQERGDDECALAPFSLLLEALWNELHGLAAQRLTGQAWAERIRRICERLIAIPPEYIKDEERIRVKFTKELAVLDDLPKCGFALIKTIIAAILQRVLTASGGSRKSGVRVSRIAELYAHPAKYVYILGMNEGVYPQKVPKKELDLLERNTEKYPADIDEADRQRMMFVTALLQAEKRVYLSYLNKDTIKDADLYPSSLIFEFETLAKRERKDRLSLPLTGYGGVKDELRAKYPDVFATHLRLDKYLAGDKKRDRKGSGEKNRRAKAAPDGIQQISLSDCAKYIANPAEGLLKRALRKKENVVWNILSNPAEPFFQIDVEKSLQTKIKNDIVRSFLLSGKDDPEQFLLKHCDEPFRKRWEARGNIPSGNYAQSYWDKLLYGKDGLLGTLKKMLENIPDLPEQIKKAADANRVYSPFIFGGVRHDPPSDPRGASLDALQYTHPDGVTGAISGEIPLLWQEEDKKICIFTHQEFAEPNPKLPPYAFARILEYALAFLPCFQRPSSFPEGSRVEMYYADGKSHLLTFDDGHEEAEKAEKAEKAKKAKKAFARVFRALTQTKPDDKITDDYFLAPVDALLACASADKITQDALLAELQERDANAWGRQDSGVDIQKLARPPIPEDKQLQDWYHDVVKPFADLFPKKDADEEVDSEEDADEEDDSEEDADEKEEAEEEADE